MAKPLPLPVWDRQRGKLLEEWMDDHQPHYESELGSEDHQLRSMLPRTALLDMLGLLQDERSHVAEGDKPGAILEHDQAGEFRRPSPGGLHERRTRYVRRFGSLFEGREAHDAGTTGRALASVAERPVALPLS